MDTPEEDVKIPRLSFDFIDLLEQTVLPPPPLESPEQACRFPEKLPAYYWRCGAYALVKALVAAKAEEIGGEDDGSVLHDTSGRFRSVLEEAGVPHSYDVSVGLAAERIATLSGDGDTGDT